MVLDSSRARLAAVAAGVHELRRRAERIGGALDVLVWSPRLSPGGGVRLLLSLLPGLLRQEAIRSIRLAVPAGALDAEATAVLRAGGLAVLELSGHNRGRAHAEVERWQGRPIEVRGNEAWRTAIARSLSATCDVVYCPWPHGELPPDAGLPIVCTYQDTTLVDYPEGLGAEGTARERSVGEAWLRHSAATVVSSRSTASNLSRLYGDLAGGVRVIRHAIQPRPLGLERAQGGSPPTGLPRRYVVFAGNIAVHKNLDLLLTAWSRFDERREWPLVVIGYGTEVLASLQGAASWRAAQLAGLVTRLGIGPGAGLHALGYVPDDAVGPLIAGAAALVMPSFTEGGGSFPVEEALQAGVPVLCSDIPVMREHLGERSATIGWFDPASVDSIGRAVRDLVADYPARKASAIAGQADPRPTWDDVAAAYAATFAEVAAAAAPGPRMERLGLAL